MRMTQHHSDGFLSRWGYPVITILFGPLVKRLWISAVHGLENIPKTGAYIIALNHESYFDFVCFTVAVNRRVHYLAAEKFFEHPLWKWVMRVMGAIRVDRFSGVNKTALREIMQRLENGSLVAIFPEGTRSPNGQLLRGKPGVAYLALHAGVPVIPVGLIGTYEIMSRADRFPRICKATVEIGKPMHFSRLFGTRPEPALLLQITHEIMLQIAALTGEHYPYRSRV